MPTSMHSPPPPTHAMIIGRNLVIAREAASLTQHQLADISGTSRATIAQIEAGASDPRLSTIVAIASALGISPQILLLGNNDISRLAALVHCYDDVMHSVPHLDDVKVMRDYLHRNTAKDRRRAAKYAADLAETFGYDDVGARVGAAIGSASHPGIGTAIGAFLGTREDQTPVDA